MWKRKTDCPERDAARHEGLRFYAPGLPCRKGHLANRYTVSGVCVACTRQGYAAKAGTVRSKARLCVYVIQAGEAIKIGITDRVETRVQVTRTHCPISIALIFCTEYFEADHARQIESVVCRELQQYSIHGSWFRIESNEACAVVKRAVTFV